MKEKYQAPWLRAAFTGVRILLLVGGLAVTAMLFGDLLRDIWNANPSDAVLNAKSNLVGAFIGSLVAGAISASAALWAVENERRHSERKERERLQALAGPIRRWCETLVYFVDGLAGDLRKWVHAEGLQERAPLFTALTMDQIDKLGCDNRIRQRVEDEFLLETRLIDRVLALKGYFGVGGQKTLEDVNRLARVRTDRVMAMKALIELLSSLSALLDAIKQLYAAISGGQEPPQCKGIEATLTAAMREAYERRNAYAHGIPNEGIFN